MRKDSIAKERVGFNDLKTHLKLVIVFMWVLLGIYALSFIIGIIAGIIEVSA